jgi:hypothetical protein
MVILGERPMSIKRKQFLLWLVIMVAVAATVYVLEWSCPGCYVVSLPNGGFGEGSAPPGADTTPLLP